MTKERKQLLIGLDNLNDKKKKKINQWVDAQLNYKNSILKLIEHAIYRFGYCDVTDYEIEKRLHTEMLVFSQDGEFFPEFIPNPKIKSNDNADNKNNNAKSDENTNIVYNEPTLATEQKEINQQNTENKIDFSSLDLENF
ncbi:hypothetical protein [Bacillus smithii]|uniref:hypothetical protein n=1 Tax=Bacillus smithii TaxID=1479 RepID=UPI00077BA8B9|nr:hypothetical protein [Bacillus smithii]